ncbi:MAG: hypothetical protein A2068_07990 [Ignavibacteria bacterium GWB2_35_6b]|nr:MAG: hypothetical protein A2068_07990 [Ignavibacteria bacterium GWB2_35_6b]
MQKYINTVVIGNNIGVLLDNTTNSEQELIEKAQHDPQAFGILFDTHYDSVYRYILYRTNNKTLAEELTSETFFKALNGLWKFKWRSIPFSAWLIRIASNEINGHFRKKKYLELVSIEEKHEILSEKIKSTNDGISNSENDFSKNLLFKKLHASIASLKNIYQEVIVLKYFEEKSIQEISELLGKSEGTVKSLLHRGLNKLKDKIDPSLYDEVKNG